jgi:hypothetical protein
MSCTNALSLFKSDLSTDFSLARLSYERNTSEAASCGCTDALGQKSAAILTDATTVCTAEQNNVHMTAAQQKSGWLAKVQS